MKISRISIINYTLKHELRGKLCIKFYRERGPTVTRVITHRSKQQLLIQRYLCFLTKRLALTVS